MAQAELEFLQMLFRDTDEYIEIRENHNRPKWLKTWEQIKNYKPPMDQEVYVGIYGRLEKGRGKADDCGTTGAIWADYDHTSLEDVKRRIKKVSLPDPTIWVFSGHGYHAYWCLDHRVDGKAEDILKALVIATGSDPLSAEKSHMMRLPGSNNNKDADRPIPCKILENNGQIYNLDVFKHLPIRKKVQGEKAQEGKTKKSHSRACIVNMLKGVPEGHRNFALGRLTAYFKLDGHTKENAWSKIKAWNQRNKPPEKENALWQSFQAYWVGDYKLLGCLIDNPELQGALEDYCDRQKCEFSRTIGKLKTGEAVGFNNRLYDQKLEGQEFIVYSLLLQSPKGLTREELTQKIGNCMSGERLQQAVNRLKGAGFAVLEKYYRVGQPNAYKNFRVRAKAQGTYGKGYTIISNKVIQETIKGIITPGQLKIYAYLSKYAYGGKGTCYPSIYTLAKDVKSTAPYVSKTLSILERKGYLIKRRTPWKGHKKTIYELLL